MTAPISEPKSLKMLLFSGNYEAVIAQTAHQLAPEQASEMIGALALSGRLDEAESAFRRLASSEVGPETQIEARFFVIAGLCHAGNTPKALRLAKTSVQDLSGPAHRARFWVWQGLALVRFFEGRFGRARGLARRALSSALEADFPYARVLALDLLAHILVHTGEVFAGMRLLEQAAALAESLGYTDNLATLRTASVTFQLRYLSTDVQAALETAEVALAEPSVSYFSRRNLLIEFAMSLALAGQSSRADRALEEAQRISLPGSDRRGKTRWLIAHAMVTALSQGADAARPIVEEAWSVAGDQLALLADLGFVELSFIGPNDELASNYPTIARATGVTRAQVASALVLGSERPRETRIEDRLGRLLLKCDGLTPDQRLRAVVDAGLLGLTPYAIRAAPGQRIIVTDREVITENHGEVSTRPVCGGPSMRFLLSLRAGYQSRETLVSSVWGLGRYSPSRHNAVINTAVSRLRLSLAEPSWVVTHDAGYQLADHVELITLEQDLPEVTVKPSSPPPPKDDRVVALIRRSGPASSADVAQQLKISPSSALRLLRKLAQDGWLIRSGSGRATRYQVPAEPNLTDPSQDLS